MEIEEKFKWKDNLRKVGDSYFLLVTPDMLKYLGIQRKETEALDSIRIMADKSKHGKFFSFWFIDDK